MRRILGPESFTVYSGGSTAWRALAAAELVQTQAIAAKMYVTVLARPLDAADRLRRMTTRSM